MIDKIPKYFDADPAARMDDLEAKVNEIIDVVNAMQGERDVLKAVPNPAAGSTVKR